MTNRRRTSNVWHFFEPSPANGVTKTVLCKLCTTEYKYLSNTSNLITHLVRKHPIQWGLVNAEQVQEDSYTEVTEYQEVNEEPSTPKSKKAKTHYVYEIKNSDNEDNANSDNEIQTKPIEEATLCSDEKQNEEWLIEDPLPFNIKITKNEKKKIKKTSEVQPSLSESLIVSNTQTRDQYNTFGDYVADRLRNLKNGNSKRHVQQLISTVIWQAEFGVFNDEENVKNVLMNMINYKAAAKDSLHNAASDS